MIPKAAFICHSSSDALEAAQLVDALESRGANCWIGPRNIRAGAPYPEEIVAAVQATDCFIIILSPAANSSQHVLRELEMAVSLRKTVVPVRVDGTKPSHSLTYLLASLQWIDTSRRALQSEPALVAETILGQRFVSRGLPQGCRIRRARAAAVGVIAVALVTSIAVVAWRGSFRTTLPALPTQDSPTPLSSEALLPSPPPPTKLVAAGTPSPPPVAAKRFSHPRWGYDCLIPDGWTPGSGGDNLAAFPFFHRDNAAAKILASGDNNPNDESLDQSISSYLASATELSRRQQILHLYNYQDGGIRRQWSPFTGQVVDYITGQERVRSLFIVTPDNGRRVRIQLFAPIDSFERFTKDFETVLESVRVFSDHGG